MSEAFQDFLNYLMVCGSSKILDERNGGSHELYRNDRWRCPVTLVFFTFHTKLL